MKKISLIVLSAVMVAAISSPLFADGATVSLNNSKPKTVSPNPPVALDPNDPPQPIPVIVVNPSTTTVYIPCCDKSRKQKLCTTCSQDVRCCVPGDSQGERGTGGKISKNHSKGATKTTVKTVQPAQR